MLQATLRRRARPALGWLTALDHPPCGRDATPIEAPSDHRPVPSYTYLRAGTSPERLAPWQQWETQARGGATPPAAAAAAAAPWALLQEPRRSFTTSSGGQGGPPHSDPDPPSPQRTWVDALPPAWQPYARLSRADKPAGSWLLAWPCFWSIALAAPPGGPLDLHTLALFGAGAVLLRGAGCTVNDLWDQDLDGQVARTASRPLPSGAVTTTQAVAWLAAQLAAGLGILLQLNPYSQALGASSLALVAAYPGMKRITGWPQAFLGLTMNWGALMGWAAVHGSCDWSVVLPLYLGGACWTLVYDTIYAHQDKADDVAAGIRSTALTFGAHNRRYLAAFAALNVGCMAAAGHAAGCGAPFLAGLAVAGAQLGWQVASVDLDDPADCAAKFVSNWWYGAALCGGIVADRLFS